MRHFDIWQWVDFVRGLGTAAARSAMDAHLSSGCSRCQRIVEVLGGVTKTARLESEYEPSKQTLRLARAIFPMRRGHRSVSPVLIFDSFCEPLPAGMRAQNRATRHTLYEAGKFFLDLQFEHEPSSGRVTLVGQLSNRENPVMSPANVPVLLMASKGPVACSICNGLGEFQLEYQPARHLRLHVPLHAAGERLELGLDRLSPPPLGRPARNRKRRIGRSASSRRA
jgi:hypothetical protein